MTEPVDPALVDRACACCRDLQVTGLIHRRGKAVLLAGATAGRDVVVKVLVDTSQVWRARFAAEVDAYRTFATVAPPVPTPRLVAADLDAGILVTTRLAGLPVAEDRYPIDLKTAGAGLLLDAAQTLQKWAAPVGAFAPGWDYSVRFRRYRTDYALLTADDEAALAALAAAAGPLRFAHGDLLPANVLHTGRKLCGVLDWEFAGLYLPGIDAALLWILLGHLPTIRKRAEQLAGADVSDRAGFLTNAAALCVRELRIHRELPETVARNQRLAYLMATWDTVRNQVHQLAGQLFWR